MSDAQQNRRVRVVAASMHNAGVLRRIRNIIGLDDREGVHIGARIAMIGPESPNSAMTPVFANLSMDRIAAYLQQRIGHQRGQSEIPESSTPGWRGSSAATGQARRLTFGFIQHHRFSPAEVRNRSCNSRTSCRWPTLSISLGDGNHHRFIRAKGHAGHSLNNPFLERNLFGRETIGFPTGK